MTMTTEHVALTAGWNGDVAFIGSSDGAFFMELGGRIHLDFRAYTVETTNFAFVTRLSMYF